MHTTLYICVQYTVQYNYPRNLYIQIYRVESMEYGVLRVGIRSIFRVYSILLHLGRYLTTHRNRIKTLLARSFSVIRFCSFLYVRRIGLTIHLSYFHTFISSPEYFRFLLVRQRRSRLNTGDDQPKIKSKF